MKKNNEELKREYMKKEMTNEQINAMKAAMEKAKKDQARSRKVIVYRKCITTAAAAVLAFIILPNTSGNVAYAMSRIPVIGKLVEVVTLRDYQYEDERTGAGACNGNKGGDDKRIGRSIGRNDKRGRGGKIEKIHGRD